jgi:hypothetical protein
MPSWRHSDVDHDEPVKSMMVNMMVNDEYA